MSSPSDANLASTLYRLELLESRDTPDPCCTTLPSTWLRLLDLLQLATDEEAVHIVRQRAGLECDDVLALSLLLTDIEVEPPALEVAPFDKVYRKGPSHRDDHCTVSRYH
jgi:hypothetical protein